MREDPGAPPAHLFSVPLISKRLELLHELAPIGTAVGVLVNPSNPNAGANERAIESAAKVIGLTVAFVGASGEPDFEDAFTRIARQRFDALIVSADGLFASRRKQLVTLAARHGVPTMYFQREFVDAGGLISYGASSPTMYHQAGSYAGRILKGATRPVRSRRFGKRSGGSGRHHPQAWIRYLDSMGWVGGDVATRMTLRSVADKTICG